MKRFLIEAILIVLILSSVSVFLPPLAKSQDSGPTTGGFRLGGSAELGYRFTDIEGRNRYKETVNLMGGLKLFDFSLWGKDLERKGLADSFSLNLTGIGDPFPFGRLEVKKNKAYDVVATYKEYKYFFDREDSFPLTDFHDFHQKRKRGTLALSLFPKDEFKLNLGYSHSERDGNAAAPRFNFPGSNQDLDLRERLNEYFISGDFPVGDWDLFVKQSFWDFENKNEMPDGPENVERRKEHVNTYTSTIKAHTQLGERWDLDTGYTFAHSEGRAELATDPAMFSPFGKGKFNFNTHILELGASHLLKKELILHLDYMYHNVNQDGFSNPDQSLSLATRVTTDYRLWAHTGTLQAEFLPRENLTLRGGYRFQYRDIEAESFNSPLFRQNSDFYNGGDDPRDTRVVAHGWIGSADWKPYKFLSIFGEYQGANFDNPYTRISPENESISKVKVKYSPLAKELNLIGTFLWKRRTNPDQDFRLEIKDYILAATYQPAFLRGLSLDASFTYENIHDQKDIVNQTLPLIPVPPASFTRFSFDSDALIYTGGISYEGIYRGFGARFSGSYARTRKENSQKYADGVLSFWYKNEWATPILALERTYLRDRERRNDSFDANLVTLSLRKDF
jgi:hypothetical protein